ncbi:hypothetical protein A8990_1794 [Paenibacillus taihuensis]|uniref:Lipoprotein n=1 Tax=Paenibacillus taihuensis TaxID=1156355 RepID=A0A3D9PX41_9BACL|nr:hypothetical protein [Paenibacillus taihuensis]REE54720.1 hypothetical protein A8990_1794 [Paenibacillus taihuensis]
MKWTAIVLILLIVLTGCTKEKDYYGGIKKDQMTDITNDPKLEYLHEFKGHTDNWGAVIYFYKSKESEKVNTRTYLVYNGKEPLQTGEITAQYMVDGDVGGDGAFGGIAATKPHEKRIFSFILGAASTSPNSDSKVQVLVQQRNNSESIDLQMD